MFLGTEIKPGLSTTDFQALYITWPPLFSNILLFTQFVPDALKQMTSIPSTYQPFPPMGLLYLLLTCFPAHHILVLQA